MQHDAKLSRRAVLIGLTASAAMVAETAVAQNRPASPPSTITTPPRDFGPGGAPTTYFNDPDVLTVDASFAPYVQSNSAIRRRQLRPGWRTVRRGRERLVLQQCRTQRRL
jgi:gluconolactonase